MKRLLRPTILILAFGCGGTEVPPIILGDGGARLMQGDARSPAEAYDMAHTRMIRQHYNVRRNLEPRTRNLYGAQSAMEAILSSLQDMKALAVAEEHPRFDPFLDRYARWIETLKRNTWGGSFLGDFDQSEREVKVQLSPSRVMTLPAFPDAAPAVTAPAPAPPPESGPLSDKVDLPPEKAPTPSPAPPTREPAPAPPAPAPPSVPFRLLFKSWDRSHDELVEAYRAKQDCRREYADVIDSLQFMKRQLQAPRTDKLQIYLDYYSDIHKKTRGFTVLPEKATADDVVDELNVAARVIRKEFKGE